MAKAITSEETAILHPIEEYEWLTLQLAATILRRHKSQVSRYVKGGKLVGNGKRKSDELRVSGLSILKMMHADAVCDILHKQESYIEEIQAANKEVIRKTKDKSQKEQWKEFAKAIDDIASHIDAMFKKINLVAPNPSKKKRKQRKLP